jgi:FkbM family methyltransferase
VDFSPLTIPYWKFLDRLSRNRCTIRSRGLTFSLQYNNWITRYRAREYNTKEPETLDWLDRHLKDGETLFDIGANIGVYTIYAALRHPAVRVVAFEPEYANLHLLRDNVIENGLSERVSIYPFALSDRSGLSTLHIQDLTPGAALSTESAQSLGVTLAGKRVVAREGTYALTVDEFCRLSAMTPNCIKLDVDGTEPEILMGAAHTLENRALRSIILEMPENESARDRCKTYLSQAGFSHERRDSVKKVSNEVWVRT